MDRRKAKGLQASRPHACPAFVVTRPCRAPHQTITDAARIGGGPMPRPGGVSRAHDGPRCLDERPECRRHVLEVLRQPLEEGFSAYQSGVSRRLRKMGLPSHGSPNGGGRKPTEAAEEADEDEGPFYRTPKEPAAVALPRKRWGDHPRTAHRPRQANTPLSSPLPIALRSSARCAGKS